MQLEIQNKLEKVFKYLGLDEKSVQFYLSCLAAGKTTINEISKEIKIPRSTCYLILEKLKTEGLIFETPFGPKRSLIAQTPENLINLLKEKNEQSQKIFKLAKDFLPALNSVVPSSQKPKVRFYEGTESVKQIYFETLKSKEISIFCLIQLKNSKNKEFKKFIPVYMEKLINKGIKTREIVTDLPSDLEYQKNYSTQNNQIINISGKNQTDTDFMIWDNKVAFISFKQNDLIGVLIEDKEIAKFEKMRFDLLWNSLTSK